jgi:hypothetical protein
MLAILADDHFLPSSPFSKNGFFGEENCFFGRIEEISSRIREGWG